LREDLVGLETGLKATRTCTHKGTRSTEGGFGAEIGKGLFTEIV
jgi:hypothetical protein